MSNNLLRISSKLSVLLASFLAALKMLYNESTFPFWGDDYLLWRYHTFSGGLASNWQDSLFQVAQDKYRPVYQFVASVALKNFENNPVSFMQANVAILLLCGLILGAIINLFVQRSVFSYSTGFLLIGSTRFTWYSTANALGILETTSTLFVLLFVYFFLKARNTNNKFYFFTSFLSFGLAIFSHERYLLIGVATSFFIFINSKNEIKGKLYLGHIPFLITIVNFLIKEFVFKVNILQGSGSDISQKPFSILLTNTAQNLLKSLETIFGFSSYSNNVNSLIALLSISFLLIFSIDFFNYSGIKFALENTKIIFSDEIFQFFSLSFFATLIPGLLEENIQERFLLIPYLLLILIALRIFNLLFSNLKLSVILICALLISFLIYNPLRYQSNYYEQSARKIYTELEVQLNDDTDEPWYLIIQNFGVSLWMIGYPINFDAGSFSQFENPPIVYWAGENLPLQKDLDCKLLIVDPLYLPQVQECN